MTRKRSRVESHRSGLNEYYHADAMQSTSWRPSVSHGQLATSAPESTEATRRERERPGRCDRYQAGKSRRPTPSVQQRKAEKLIKEHGSPPGIRVTAGGRIVQTMFTPTGSPAMPKAKGNDFQHNEMADEFMYPPNVALYPPLINHMGMMAPFVAAPYAQHAVMAMPPHGIAVPVQGPYPLPMVPIPFPNCPEPMISVDDAISSTIQRIKELEHALNLHEREMIFRDSFGRKMDPLEKKTAVERKREFVNQMNVLRNQAKYFESEKANNVLHVSPGLLLPQSDVRPRTPVLRPHGRSPSGSKVSCRRDQENPRIPKRRRNLPWIPRARRTNPNSALPTRQAPRTRARSIRALATARRLFPRLISFPTIRRSIPCGNARIPSPRPRASPRLSRMRLRR